MKTILEFHSFSSVPENKSFCNKLTEEVERLWVKLPSSAPRMIAFPKWHHMSAFGCCTVSYFIWRSAFNAASLICEW